MAREVLDHGVILPAEYSDDWYEDMTSNLQKLDDVIGSDSDKLSASDVATVAISGDYDDLTNKPSYGILRMTSETLSDSGSGAISNLNSDSKLAAGDYVLDAALKVFPIAAVSAPNYTVGTSLFQITNASALAAVATSGSYDDLNNLPAYGITRFVNAAISDNSNIAFANISSVDKIKAGDFLLDNAGKMYLISSVDSVNESVSVTTPLTQLAVDANVVHTNKNDDVSIPLNSTSAELGVTGGYTNITFLDKNDKKLSGLTFGNYSSSKLSYARLSIFDKDTNNNEIQDTLEYAYVSNNANAYLRVNKDNFCALGSISYRWKGVYATNYYYGANNVEFSTKFVTTDTAQTITGQKTFSSIKTNQINGLTPSSLSMPSDRSTRIDISGYFTNTSSGDTNTYTVPANGWIYLNLNNVVVAHCFAQTAGSLSHYGQTFARASAGQLHCLFPVRKDDVFVSQWDTTTTVTVTNAYFIPCQGNI